MINAVDREKLIAVMLLLPLADCVQTSTVVVERGALSHRAHAAHAAQTAQSAPTNGPVTAHTSADADVIQPPQAEAVQPSLVLAEQVPQVDRLTAIRELRVINPERTADEPIRILLGNIRAELAADGRITFGHDRTVYPLRAASRDASGRWAFLSGDGLAVASESFLGRFQRLGETRRQILSVATGVGSISVVDRLNRSYLVTPTEIRRWPTLWSSAAVSMGPSLGAYLDMDRNAFWLRDGRAQTAIAVDASSARGFELHQGALYVRTTHGLKGVRDDGSTFDFDERTLPRTTLTPAQEWAVIQALFERYPSTLWSLVPEGTVSFATATVRFRNDLALVDVRTRRIVHLALGTVPATECTERSWGPHLIESCPHSFNLVTLARNRVRLSIPQGTLGTQFSDDGVHAIARGRCHGPVDRDESWRARNVRELCVTSDSGAHWRSLPLSFRAASIHHVRGKYALVVSQADSHRAISLVDLDTGRASVLAGTVVPGTSRSGVLWAQFAGDGHIWAVLGSSLPTQVFMAQWNDAGLPPTLRDLGSRPTIATAMLNQSAIVRNSYSDAPWGYAPNVSQAPESIEDAHPDLVLSDECNLRFLNRPLLQCSTSECINGPFTVFSFVAPELRKTPALSTTQHFAYGRVD